MAVFALPLIALAQGGVIPAGLAPCKMKHEIKGCTEKTSYNGKTADCRKWQEGQEKCQSDICCLLDVIYTIVNWIFVVLLVAASVFILWAGIEFTTSRGNINKVISARKKVLWALVGVIVAFLCKVPVSLTLGTISPEKGGPPAVSLSLTTGYIIDQQGNRDGILSLEGDYTAAAKGVEQLIADQIGEKNVIRKAIANYRQTEVLTKPKANYRSPDFNKDGIVNIFDLVQLGKRTGTKEGEAGYKNKYDVNRDGTIDTSDLVVVGYYFDKNPAEYPALFSSLDEPYQPKQVFLVSDENWKDILPLVPVSTHDDHRYPVLIYHREGENQFDADSILYFFEQYRPSRIVAVVPNGQNLPEALVSEINNLKNAIGYVPPVILTSPNENLKFFPDYTKVVYVDNNYRESLVASIYAAFINAPLVIKDTFLDKPDVFKDKKKIYSKTEEDWQKRVLEIIDGTKIIMVNPNDLDIMTELGFHPKKSNESISKLYAKTSLIAPFLAAAKKEIILPIAVPDYTRAGIIKAVFKDKISRLGLVPLYLTIIASPPAIEMTSRRSISDKKINTYGEVDNIVYGNLDEDIFTELAVGRIFGITSSDFSSYVARDLFYNHLSLSDNFAMLVTDDFMEMKIRGKANDRFLTKLGFAKQSIYEDEGKSFNEEHLKNKFLVSYSGHGWWQKIEGITSRDLRATRFPPSILTLFISNACSTCDFLKGFLKGNLFCANLLRKGVLANVAAIDRTSVHLVPSKLLLEHISRENSIGLAFKNFKNLKHVSYFMRFMRGLSPSSLSLLPYEDTFILLGDPTINLNLRYPYASAETVETEIEDLVLDWWQLREEGDYQHFQITSPTEVSYVQLYLRDLKLESGDIKVEIVTKSGKSLTAGYFSLPRDKVLSSGWHTIRLPEPIELESDKYFIEVTPGYAAYDYKGNLLSFTPKQLNAEWAFLKTPDKIDPRFYEFHNYLFKINQDIKFDILEPENYKLAVISIPQTPQTLSFTAGGGTEQNNALMYEAYPGKEVTYFKKAVTIRPGDKDAYNDEAVYIWPISIANIKDIIRVEYLNPTKDINFPFLWGVEESPIYKISQFVSSIGSYRAHPQSLQVMAFKDDNYFLALSEFSTWWAEDAQWPWNPMPPYQYKIYLKVK